VLKPARVAASGSWDFLNVFAEALRSKKSIRQGSLLESRAIEGDSPVPETESTPRKHPSTAGHEKPCGNLGGPPSKAKYYLATDSELVP
jgi:hypothetical protein